MIESKRINIIIAVALCLALALTATLVVYGDSDAAKVARQAKYVTELFGDEIISINIIVDESDWQEMLASASAKEYIMADVMVNGERFQSVGVRTKGNASLSQVSNSGSPERYSLHIKFNKYISKQTCFGLDELILNNMISDSTYMKEYMSQDIMRYIGVEAPLTNHASIAVNGEGFGFYVALESYGSSYNKRVYEDTTGNYYNVKTMQVGGGGNMAGAFGGNMGGGMQRPQGNQANQEANAPAAEDWNDRAGFVGRGGGGSGGTLQYTNDDISSYSAIFDNASGGTPSTADQMKVIEALKNLATGTELEKYFDVDGILRYFAAHTVVVNLDSYYSNMAQNYFLYERNGQIHILPWDYHLSYGAFQSGSAGDVVNFPIDTPVSGVTMESRPLLNMLLANEEYSAKYHQYLQEIVEGYFNSGLFAETVRNLQDKIADYVQSDPSAYYTYDQFETGVETLIRLNLLRAESIAGQLAGMIPATTEGQSGNSAALIDASSINMSDLGSNGMGGGGGRGNWQGNAVGENGFGMPGGQNMPNMPGGGNFIGGEMPDMAVMAEAMQIIQEAGGVISEEMKARLMELGLSEEQITMFSAVGGGGRGNRQGNAPGVNAGNNQPEGNIPGGVDQGETQNMPRENTAPPLNATVAANTVDTSYLTLLGILILALLGATIFAVKLKRNY